MTIKEFALMLDCGEYGDEMTKEECKKAQELGFVIVFGYSDDNIEFRGAIHDEIGCYEGGTVNLNADGIIEECEENCIHYQKALKTAKKIQAVWFDEKINFPWSYETDIPHEKFYIYEDNMPYCVGIVFDIKDLT